MTTQTPQVPSTEASTSHYDAVVIGGGPGGSTAAAYARLAGMKTLVVEKEAFPRFRIGESMLPTSNGILRETGAWPKIESAGFIPKYGAFFYLDKSAAVKEVDFSKSKIKGLDSTFQVERAKFDAILLDHAQSLGAEVRMQTTVRAVESNGEINRLELDSASGKTTVTARWVFDACGRDNAFLTEQKRQLDTPTSPKRMAVYSHFKHVPRPKGRTGGNIIIVRLEDGWFWIIPIDAEHTSVGLVTTAEKLKAGGSPEALFHATVAGSLRLSDLMGEAVATMPFRVTSDYTYFRKELAKERLLLVGDSAGFFDPIFSSGVYMSLWSAQTAVRLAVKADAGKRTLTPGERARYTKDIKTHANTFRKLIQTFYDNKSFEVFMCSPVPWDMMPGLTSIVAGHAKLTWPLWWRFNLFLLVCKIHRRFSIVPKLDYHARVGG